MDVTLDDLLQASRCSEASLLWPAARLQAVHVYGMAARGCERCTGQACNEMHMTGHCLMARCLAACCGVVMICDAEMGQLLRRL